MLTITEPQKRTSNEQYVRETFPVLEMTFAACAVSVESRLKSTAGVKVAGVNFANQTAWAVEWIPSRSHDRRRGHDPQLRKCCG